ncbi:hypothetical protein JTB14_019703 [Gonioctena quinquepunctata]|nr:hypothetical protein JTB14_019703 [Gonioctena quinquepunctata]
MNNLSLLMLEVVLVFFLRVHYEDHMLSNGLSGELGSAHVPGWRTETNFVRAMEHFVSHVKPSEKNPAAFRMSNGTQGFIETGIYPSNSEIFLDDDFLISYVTDRPDPVPSDDTT